MDRQIGRRTERLIGRKTYRGIYRQTGIKTESLTSRERHTQTKGHSCTERQADIQTHRWMGKNIDRRPDRQA
jgi:hypothetical protein